MNLLLVFLAFVLTLLFMLACMTRIGSWLIERRYPPAGRFATIDGARIHYVHLPAPEKSELPPIVFIHGASANLNDQMVPLRPLIEGRAEILFVDRPGHGWSERGAGNNETPDGQAATIAALMRHLGIDDAIVVGHSFGGAVAAAFALTRPEMTRGLVFVSAASHPWPGAATAWYYTIAAMPVIGRLFVETIASPAGAKRMAAATESVFAPNRVPASYLQAASIPLILRPAAFRCNAIDVEGLYRHVVAAAPRYPRIEAPSVVISGDRDAVVYEEVHSVGLARDIPGAELVWVRNLGHKPDWLSPDLVVAAIEKVAGRKHDLQALARQVEARLTDDAFGAGTDAEAPAEAFALK